MVEPAANFAGAVVGALVLGELLLVLDVDFLSSLPQDATKTAKPSRSPAKTRLRIPVRFIGLRCLSWF